MIKLHSDYARTSSSHKGQYDKNRRPMVNNVYVNFRLLARLYCSASGIAPLYACDITLPTIPDVNIVLNLTSVAGAPCHIYYLSRS